MWRSALAATVLAMLGAPLAAADRPDLLFDDFEADRYEGWEVAGEAFGDRPAPGTLPGQMGVSGFLGKGLVNSFRGGDDSTGKMTRPITIERNYLNFLIGGGKYPGETCINLVIDGEVVRTATGPNDRPGGSEQLDWASWDLRELAGKKGTIEIVDSRQGGWGHINVDHIVQSDKPRQTGPQQRELTVERRYLYLPVKNGAPKTRLKLLEGDDVLREFEIELAHDDQPDFEVSVDLAAFQGKKLTLHVSRAPSDSPALARLRQHDEPPGNEGIYQEKYRPQLHFTARRGWLNDPNGLVFYDGEYHLFFQHNPYGWNWGNMHWGHAVSRDLIHWRELPIALYPRTYGDFAFSGSAVVDKENTSGFQSGDEEVLVLAYTSTGRGECIAYSNDHGRTWREYDGNPVVRHQGRDPKLVWHAPTERWIMAVYTEAEGKQWIAFHTSPDLKNWEFASRIEGYYECPDLFEIAVEGTDKKKWVLYAADGKYVVGQFDGRRFTPEGPKQQLWYGAFYAAQTYDNAPDGRRIQVGWGRGVEFPGMPFNQQMTIPVDLTLHAAGDRYQMRARPVQELARLDVESQAEAEGSGSFSIVATAGSPPLRIAFEAERGTARSIDLELGDLPIEYNVERQELRCGSVRAPLALDGRPLRYEVLVDRGSVEVFADGGRVALLVAHRFPPAPITLTATARDGENAAGKLRVQKLRSAWKPMR